MPKSEIKIKNIAVHADWFLKGQRWHHLVRCLIKRGHRVSVYSTRGIKDVIPSMLGNSTGLFRPGMQKIYVRTTLPTRLRLKKITCEYNAKQVAQIQQDFLNANADFKIWTGSPPSIQIKPPQQLIYDCVDDCEGMPWVADDYRVEYAEIAEAASEILVVSSALFKKFYSRYPQKTFMVPNGADYEHFCDVPSLRARNVKDRHKVGYMGALSSWFDEDLLARVADKLPQWDFLLAGKNQLSKEQAKKLKKRNIKYLGYLKYSELPKFLSHINVGIIPFKIINITKATSPIKLFEYLAAGMPVVSTKIPDICPLEKEGVLKCVETADEFVEALQESLIKNNVNDRVMLAKANSWEIRFGSFFHRWSL